LFMTIRILLVIVYCCPLFQVFAEE